MKRPFNHESDISNKNPIVFLDVVVGPEKGILRKVMRIPKQTLLRRNIENHDPVIVI